MSKEASRIRRVISRLLDRDDIAELVRMARLEVVIAVFTDDGQKLERSLAIYRAAGAALSDAGVRGELPRHPQAA